MIKYNKGRTDVPDDRPVWDISTELENMVFQYADATLEYELTGCADAFNEAHNLRWGLSVFKVELPEYSHIVDNALTIAKQRLDSYEFTDAQWESALRAI